MDTSGITTFIQTVGFPIAAYCALFWRMVQSDKAHAAEVDKLRETVEANTLVMTKLCDRLEEKNNV